MNHKRFEHKKHIFFDLDHTLWDFEKNSALAYKQIFEINNLDYDVAIFNKEYSTVNLKYWKLFREEKISVEQMRYQRLKEVFTNIEVFVSDDIINKIAQDYIFYLTHNSHLIEGANEVLPYLHKKYNLHIITNGFKEIQKKKLINSNIYHFFKTVTDAEDAGVKKPNKEIFRLALQKAGAIEQDSLMIGDSLEVDVFGAISVGIDAILYKDTHIDESIQKDWIEIISLKDLYSFL